MVFFHRCASTLHAYIPYSLKRYDKWFLHHLMQLYLSLITFGIAIPYLPVQYSIPVHKLLKIVLFTTPGLILLCTCYLLYIFFRKNIKANSICTYLSLILFAHCARNILRCQSVNIQYAASNGKKIKEYEND